MIVLSFALSDDWWSRHESFANKVKEEVFLFFVISAPNYIGWSSALLLVITHNPWNPRSIFGVERSSGHHGQSELKKVDQEHPGGRQQTGTSNAIHQERERAGNDVQVEGQGGLEEVEEGAGGERKVWSRGL